MKKLHKYSKYLVILLVVATVIIIPKIALANHISLHNSDATLKIVTGRSGVEQTDVATFIGSIINGVLGLVGLMFFILMFYGGFQWITSRGEEDKVKKSQNIILAAIIGLIIVVGSYAITNFITSRLT